MLASTVRLAIGISIAGSHALTAVLCAYEVWEGLGKLGSVGGNSVTTNARICKGVLFNQFDAPMYGYCLLTG